MKLMKTIAVLALAAAIAALCAWGADEIDVTPAMGAAQAWLAHVDAGRYGESWDEAAASLRESVRKAEWQTTLDAKRSPLGVTIARKLRSATFTRSLPGSPDGEYVVIRYDTRFDQRPQSTETVIPMREKDGSWKVAGYVIQ